MYYDDSSASSTESESASSCEMKDPFYNFSKTLDRISRNACPGQAMQDAVANNPAGDLPFGNQMLLNGPSAQAQNAGYHPKFGVPVTAPENIPPVNNPPESGQKPDTSQLFTQEFVNQNPQFGQLPSVIPEHQQPDYGAAGNTNNNSSSSDEMENRGRSPTVRRTNPLHYIVEKKVSFQQGDKLPEKKEVHCNKNNNTGNNKQKKKTKKSKKHGKK